MFRKIISNLSFSPALISQLGFYAKRLRKEQTTRRVGLIFTALAIAVQSLTVFTPPQSANAASANDMIYGGVASVAGANKLHTGLNIVWDENRANFRSIMESVGITKQDLAASTYKQAGLNTRDCQYQSWGHLPKFSYAQGERAWNYGNGTVYARPSCLWNDTNRDAMIGYSAGLKAMNGSGWFAILLHCGNLVTAGMPSKPTPTPPPAPTPPPTPVPSLVCSSLQATISGKRVTLKLTPGEAKNGAQAVSYHFIIKNASGAVITDVTTPNNQVTTGELPGYGTFSVQGYINTTNAGVPTCATTFTIPTPPQPRLICNTLTITPIDRTNTKLTITATAENGAAISGYTFVVKDKDGKVVFNKTDKTNTQQVTLPKDGTYTATGSITSTNAGTPSCAARQIVVAPQPTCPTGTVGTYPNCEKPAANCTTLAVAKINRQQFKLAGTATVEHTATIQGYIFVIKDKSGKIVKTETIKTAEKSATYTTEKLADGTYTATLSVMTSVGNKTAADCSKQIIVSKAAPCELTGVTTGITVEDKECQPCPPVPGNTTVSNQNQTIWYKSDKCAAQVLRTKSAVNNTQNKDATAVAANAGDTITFTLTMTNQGNQKSDQPFTDDVSYLLNYAELVDNGGAKVVKTSTSQENGKTTLDWGTLSVDPGQVITKTIVVKVKNPLPATARGLSDPEAFDCKISNTFGNTVNIKLNCPAPKIVEQTVSNLPKTGAGANMIFSGILFAIVVYFYARSRQLGTEVRLVRRDFNTGTI